MLKPNNMENRVIKFRMWNNGKMYPVTNPNTMDCLKQQVAWDNNVATVKFDHISDGAIFMQFTGLLDKNGKEIYEGDIFGAEDECLVILWSDGWAKFQVHIYGFDTYHNEGGGEEVNTKRTVLSTDDIEPFELEQYEIIGNIYENPELLNSF